MGVIVSSLLEEVPQEAANYNDIMGLVEKVVLTVLTSEGYGEEAEVSVVFTGDSHIRELNMRYRGQDSPTDVLSFALNEGDPMPDPGEEDLLGDVVISLEAAVRQGKEYGHGLRREVAYLAAHGVLHLLGYDHHDEEGRAVMREKEEAALAALGIGKG
jgi:probable rRNA maturation factor